MNSVTTERFRKAYSKLPTNVKKAAKKAYKQWQNNPSLPSLHFKKIHPAESIYSVRINLEYRALGVKQDDTMIWFWIGSHGDYDQLLNSL